MNLNQTAQNIYHGLLWGLCTVKDCTLFADSLISNKEAVPYPIIELSLSSTASQAMSAITPLIKYPDKFEMLRFALGRMHFLGLAEPERLVHFASLLFQERAAMDYQYPEEFELLTMDHEYEIADVLEYSYDNANRNFIQALSAFQKENSHQFDWFVANTN